MVTINREVRLDTINGVAVGEYEFKGLSIDDKPTVCGVNSLFLELDTGAVYYFDGENWLGVGSGLMVGEGDK